MSEIRTNPISILNPKLYSKSLHSFFSPNGGLQKYFFELTINPNFINEKTFRKFESNKYTELIQLDDDIIYHDIKEFKLVVSKMPFDTSFNYELKGKLCHDCSSYNQCKNDIYIEFSQNSSGITFCSSSFIGIDFTKFCISPPN